MERLYSTKTLFLAPTVGVSLVLLVSLDCQKYANEGRQVLSAWIATTIWVIPSHVNKSFDMTISELDETWYAGSTFGFVMPDKISVPFIVWFPG